MNQSINQSTDSLLTVCNNEDNDCRVEAADVLMIDGLHSDGFHKLDQNARPV